MKQVSSTLLLFIICLSCKVIALTPVITTKNDPRSFEYLQLENALKVLLISDPKADKAAVALDVNVGSGEDPMDRFGLAHFLEHMLFLGTEKYPVPGEFQSYVDAHSGNHNAYTSLMHTNYFFDVEPAAFEEALDRFAQFFIHPLFLRDYVERERQAVHSEFTSKYFQNSRRERDVFRELTTPGHPLSKFSTGNMDTLSQVSADQLRKDLVTFYEKYYSANVMALVVSSPMPLEKLKPLVVDLFSRVENKALVAFENDKALFPEGFLPAEVHIAPKKLTRKLALSFPIPSTEEYRDSKPLHYIGNILGHEGEGSVFSILKKMAWATALSAGTQFDWRDGEMFSIQVYLTEKGYENIALIKSLIFYSIDQFKSEGINRWRFEELRDLGKISFDFHERGKPINEVSGMANMLHKTKAEKIIWQSFNFERFEPKTIEHFLGYLNPNNALTTVVAPEITQNRDNKKVSEIYQVPYVKVGEKAQVVESHDAKKLAALKSQIGLPKKNPFIAKKFNIIESKNKKAEDEIPQRIIDTPAVQGWYLNDNIYDAPKTAISARFKLPQVSKSAEHYVATKIYVRLMKDALNLVSYNASLAGLSYSLSATARGIDVDFYGYSDSVDDLSKHVIKQLKSFDRSKKQRSAAVEKHFEEVRTELYRLHLNRKHAKVYSQIMAEMPAYLYSPYWTYEQVDTAFQALTPEMFGEIIDQLFASGKVEALVFGNASKKQAKREIKRIAGLLKTKHKTEVADGQVTKLAREQQYLQTMLVDSQDVSVVHYFQANDDTVKQKATLRLLERLISTPFYNALRTEQQLGYIVFSANYPVRRVPGIVAIVQSPQFGALDVHQRMREFFREHESHVFADFEKHKQALLHQLAEKPKNQMGWADYYWRSILEDEKDFEGVQQMLNSVRQLDREALEKVYRDMFITHEPNLTFVASNPQQPPQALGEKMQSIHDSAAFKKALPRYRFP